MNHPVEIVGELLRSAGLTAYEAEAYGALLPERELSAEEISRASKIPITRVYDTLDGLVLKGFAKLVPGRPKKYQSRPPGEATKNYLEFLKREYELNVNSVHDALQRIQKAVEPIYWKSHLQVKPEELIEPLSNLHAMEERTLSSIDESREEVLISSALFSWLPKVRRELLRASARGVQVRILMQIENQETRQAALALLKAGIKARQTSDPWHPVRGTLVDSRTLVFVIWASEESERFWYPKVYRPQLTSNPGVIRLFRESFEYRWSRSTTIKMRSNSR